MVHKNYFLMETLILKQPRLNFNKGQGEEEADFTLP